MDEFDFIFWCEAVAVVAIIFTIFRKKPKKGKRREAHGY